VVAGADVDRGTTEGGNVLGEGLVDPVNDAVGLLHGEAAIDHDVQFRADFVAEPPSPRLVNALDTVDVHGGMFDLGQDLRFDAV
jgi:hypothetical protein